MKRLIVLAFIGILIGVLSMSCSKETITGPTKYAYDTMYDSTIVIEYDTIHDTTIVEVPVYTPTKVHAYVVSQVFLDPEVLAYVEATYVITITSWTSHYSHLWDATQITQNGNNFKLTGTVVPLFTYVESRYDDLYYDIIEYADIVLTYKDGDPSNPNNWTAGWAASTTTFSAQGMSKR